MKTADRSTVAAKGAKSHGQGSAGPLARVSRDLTKVDWVSQPLAQQILDVVRKGP